MNTIAPNTVIERHICASHQISVISMNRNKVTRRGHLDHSGDLSSGCMTGYVNPGGSLIMHLGSGSKKVVDILTDSQFIARYHTGRKDNRVSRSCLDLGMLPAGDTAQGAERFSLGPGGQVHDPPGFIFIK